MAAWGGKSWRRGDRVLIYVRVSKVGDRSETLISDDVQEEVCRRWADREGLSVVDVVVDLDKTGREASKRQVGKLIERVRSGDAEGVLVWKISRWGRNLLDSMLNVAALQAAGGFIASATESLDDIETPMGRFSLAQMLAIAQLQSDQIGETWRNIQDHRVARGLPRDGNLRWGYERHEIGRDDDPSGAYTPHPQQAPWLKWAYEQFVAGRSLGWVAARMREAGVRTNAVSGDEGQPMNYQVLRNIMDSGFAAGLIVTWPKTTKSHYPAAGRYDKGAHEPIIDEALWQAYVNRRNSKRAPRNATAVHRLSGLVRCAACGRSMVHRPVRKDMSERFACSYYSSSISVTRNCAAPTVISAAVVYRAVLSWLQGLGGAEAMNDELERLRAEEHSRSDIEQMQREVERLRRLRLGYLDQRVLAVDDMERAEMDSRRRELGVRIEELLARIDEAQRQVAGARRPDPEAATALLALWEQGDPGVVSETLREVIRAVYVHKQDKEAGHVGTARVEIVGWWQADPGYGA